MNSRQIQHRQISLRTASIAALVLVAAFLAIQPANQALADEGMMILKGRVASVDSYNRTISVLGTAGALILSIPTTTNVTLCDRNMSFGNLAAGQNVTVTYHEYDGNLVADTVDIAPITLACYNQ